MLFFLAVRTAAYSTNPKMMMKIDREIFIFFKAKNEKKNTKNQTKEKLMHMILITKKKEKIEGFVSVILVSSIC